MAQLIDAAVASQPDGLVVSIPDAAALGNSIKNAVASGIPVVSMNSGSDVREELGVLVHVGQTEFEAGEGGGKQMKAAGVTKAICVNQEVGNVALDLRCEGFAKGLGGDVEVVAVGMDPTEIQSAVKAQLAANADIGGVLALGPSAAEPTLAALEELGVLDKVKFGTFDLSPGVLRGDPRRQDAVRDRPAAVPAGLPADRAADALPQVRPDAGRHGDDRPGLRHQGQRGPGDRAERRRASADAVALSPEDSAPRGDGPVPREVRTTWPRPRRRRATSGWPRAPLVATPDGPPRAGRGRRHHPGVPVLRLRRRRHRDVLGPGHRHLPRGVGPARHPRRGGGAADDRRRVRPLGRLDDRRRRRGPRHPGGDLGLAACGCASSWPSRSPRASAGSTAWWWSGPACPRSSSRWPACSSCAG